MRSSRLDISGDNSGSAGVWDCWDWDRLITARWKSPRGTAEDIPLSVDLAILVTWDVTVGAWDWEGWSVSMGSGPAPSGLDVKIFEVGKCFLSFRW